MDINFKKMCNIIRLVIMRLWGTCAFSFLCGFTVYWFFGVTLSCVVSTIGVLRVLYVAQDLMLYYPNEPLDSRYFVLQPSNFMLPYESYKIKSRDGVKVHMFLIKQTTNSNNVPTMIFFHGNSGNMGQRLSNISGYYHELGINILMVEYRGYGLSEGSPCESGFYKDAQTAFDFLMQRSDIDRNKILLFGRSLGGAVAIDLASRLEYRNKVWAVILENTFTSIPDMAKVVLRWRCLKWLPLFFHKNKYMSLDKIAHVSSPTMIICGSNDVLVPPEMGKELYKKCGAVSKNMSVVMAGGHDDTWTHRNYYLFMKEFLNNVPQLEDAATSFYNEVSPSTSFSDVHIV